MGKLIQLLTQLKELYDLIKSVVKKDKPQETKAEEKQKEETNE